MVFLLIIIILFLILNSSIKLDLAFENEKVRLDVTFLYFIKIDLTKRKIYQKLTEKKPSLKMIIKEIKEESPKLKKIKPLFKKLVIDQIEIIYFESEDDLDLVRIYSTSELLRILKIVLEEKVFLIKDSKYLIKVSPLRHYQIFLKCHLNLFNLITGLIKTIIISQTKLKERKV